MQYSDIVQKVQTTAQIDSPEAAQKAIQAVLKTLKERILGDEASNLAAQLPEEIGQYLRGQEGENGQHFSLKEFYERVGQAEGVDGATAAIHVRGIFSVLREAVSPGEFENVKNNLSDDYEELFAVPAAR